MVMARPDDVHAPSAIAWNEHHANPKAMTLEDIEEFKKAFADAVRRAVDVGFDAIEIHNGMCLPASTLRSE